MLNALSYRGVMSGWFIYSIYLKLFLTLIGPIIYEEGYNISIFEIRDGVAESLMLNLYTLVICDLFWFFPFTLLNIFVFWSLLKELVIGNERSSQKINSTILNTYCLWCLIYLISIGFDFFLDSNDLDSLFGGPFVPFGSLSIVYFLLGNYSFAFLVLRLFKRDTRKWILR